MSQRTRQIQLQASWETSNKKQTNREIDTVSDEWYYTGSQTERESELEAWRVSWIRRLGKPVIGLRLPRRSGVSQESVFWAKKILNSKVLET